MRHTKPISRPRAAQGPFDAALQLVALLQALIGLFADFQAKNEGTA